MNYLLDTHVFLWMAAEPERLSLTVREIVEQDTNNLFLSAASAWEVSLLWKIGRIELREEPSTFVHIAIHSLGITPLAIGFDTAMTAATLPFIHRDPFDRILVAEAIKNGLTLLSKDQIIPRLYVENEWKVIKKEAKEDFSICRRGRSPLVC